MTMTRAHLTQHFPKTEELAQQRRAIYVDVSVLTESGEIEASDILGSGGRGVRSIITASFVFCPLLLQRQRNGEI